MKNNIFALTLLFSCFACIAQSQPVKLSSHPSASATIYLDFDGEEVISPMWNNGEPINCLPTGFTNTQIAEVFSRVAEDYRPFDINITTDADVFNTAPFDRRIRVIVTPTSSWFANVGGVSYLSSFTWGDDTPCFVFSDKLGPNNPKMVAECSSHESGHALGLSHQSKYDEGCHLAAAYHDGTGTGETAWAPIMGNSYYRNMSGWSNGPTPYGCGSNQDNLSILTTQNGFGFRADDHSDDMSQSPTQLNLSNINTTGIISSNGDQDAFSFTLLHNSNFHLQAVPFNTGGTNDGANLDIKLSLYDAAKNLLQVFDPGNSMSVIIDTILNAGNYYVLVEGTGNMNATAYGSLGSYTIKGLYGVLPVCTINLNGVVKNNVHQLNWQINCNEVISTVKLQSSVNGVQFSDVNTVTNSSVYNHLLFQNIDMYYRLQVNTRSGNIFYSTTTMLKKPADDQQFIVSSFITSSISILAPSGFKYQLADINGNRLLMGNGKTGYNQINMQNKPAGAYLLVLYGEGVLETVRVIKQ